MIFRCFRDASIFVTCSGRTSKFVGTSKCTKGCPWEPDVDQNPNVQKWIFQEMAVHSGPMIMTTKMQMARRECFQLVFKM